MTEQHDRHHGTPFAGEPDRDIELARLLQPLVGGTAEPLGGFGALASRLTSRLAQQAAISIASPWWTYAARWERRAIPVALAAGLVAVAALLGLGAPIGPLVAAQAAVSISASALSTEVANGSAPEDAASLLAHSITSSVDLAAGIPE